MVILLPILAFLSGLFLGSFFPFLPCSIGLLLLTGGLVLTWFERARKFSSNNGLILFGSVMGGMIYWAVALGGQAHPELEKYIGLDQITITGTVVESVHRAPERVIIIVKVSKITQGHMSHATAGRLQLSWRNPDQAIYQGSQIDVSARLRLPYGTVNPGGFDYGTYLKRKGIHAVATVSGAGAVRILDDGAVSYWAWPWNQIDQWRSQILQASNSTLKGPALGLFLGMIIGEQSSISPEDRDSFMTTGTVHIISISGSHLGLVAFLTFFLVKGLVLRLPASWLERLSRRITATRLAALTTIPCVTFYTLLAGAQTPTVRSWIMIVFYLFAVWLGRERNILRPLSIAALLVLLHDPQAMYDISFQLSFVSVLAIALVFHGNPSKVEENEDFTRAKNVFVTAGWNWTKQASRLTCAVTLATLPLVAYYFNQIAWLGLLANLVVVPFVGFIVVPLGLLSAIVALMSGAETLPLAPLNQMILDVLSQVVTILATIPGAEWHVASPAMLSIGVFYGLLVMTVWGLRQKGLRWACAVGVILITSWWAWSPRILNHELRVTFLDVGQGDATVIELPDGKTVLIDGGPVYTRLDMGRAVVGPYLWDRGISRLDHIVATHPQWDHIGGLAWLLQNFAVGRYWSNGATRNKPFYDRVQQALQEGNLTEEIAWQGKEVTRAGPCKLDVLNPQPSRGGPESVSQASFQSGTNLNNHSIITRIDCGLHSFLFTADAEQEALWRLNQLPKARTARVVKVPHHGAKSSLNREWINQLTAEAAIISVGQRNHYGHPVPAVLRAYEQKGIPLYRTDQDGAVWITAKLSSSKLNIHTAREQLLQPVALDASFLKNEGKNWTRLWNRWMGIL